MYMDIMSSIPNTNESAGPPDGKLKDNGISKGDGTDKESQVKAECDVPVITTETKQEADVSDVKVKTEAGPSETKVKKQEDDTDLTKIKQEHTDSETELQKKKDLVKVKGYDSSEFEDETVTESEDESDDDDDDEGSGGKGKGKGKAKPKPKIKKGAAPRARAAPKKTSGASGPKLPRTSKSKSRPLTPEEAVAHGGYLTDGGEHFICDTCPGVKDRPIKNTKHHVGSHRSKKHKSDSAYKKFMAPGANLACFACGKSHDSYSKLNAHQRQVHGVRGAYVDGVEEDPGALGEAIAARVGTIADVWASERGSGRGPGGGGDGDGDGDDAPAPAPALASGVVDRASGDTAEDGEGDAGNVGSGTVRLGAGDSGAGDSGAGDSGAGDHGSADSGFGA
ncbi:hypothetical protein F5Y15DRAFT_165980 [Xylariaceae sp. FL0016]|nr:hypothetical protein F5Y15DRAFT_165980 [Xylariaceae sp. FL0016]